MNPSVAIAITDLSKRYGSTRALDGMSMTVAAGSVHGFLGPNGAGKSTALRILLGLAKPDGGRVEVLGSDPWRRTDHVGRVAYVPGDVGLWPGLTGGEVLTLLTSLRGRPNPRRRAALIEKFELDTTRRAKTYSKGNRQKVALIAALESDAELLILDEPTTGLDPLMEAVFRESIATANASGTTVLLSSHMLAEVDALCDAVTIIRGGRTVESGTLAHLRRLTRLQVAAELDRPAGGFVVPLGVHDVATSGEKIECTVDRDGLDELLRALTLVGVRDLRITPIALEDLFLRQYLQPGASARDQQ